MQIAKILEATVTHPDTRLGCEVDSSSSVYSLLPKTSKTFEEYSVQDVIPKIQIYSLNFMRTDIDFDVYWTSSQKAETKSKRDNGDQCQVVEKIKLPPNWKSFLRDNNNKSELFGFLADKIVTLCPDNVTNPRRSGFSQQIHQA